MIIRVSYDKLKVPVVWNGDTYHPIIPAEGQELSEIPDDLLASLEPQPETVPIPELLTTKAGRKTEITNGN